MKVLTIKEPWASLIINGYKEYEFRSWKTNYRGHILIQASKSPDKENLKRFVDYNLDYGCGEIIGEVEITDCIKLDEHFHNKLKSNNVYSTSPIEGYAICLKNIKKYEKRIPCKGQLGLWNLEQ